MQEVHLKMKSNGLLKQSSEARATADGRVGLRRHPDKVHIRSLTAPQADTEGRWTVRTKHRRVATVSATADPRLTRSIPTPVTGSTRAGKQHKGLQECLPIPRGTHRQ